MFRGFVSFLNFLLTVFLITVALAVGGFYYGWSYYTQPNSLNRETIVYIPKGSSVKMIGDRLEEDGAIPDSSSVFFEIAVHLLRKNASLRAGEYLITPQMTMEQIIEKIAKGEILPRNLTVAEGLTTYEILTLINDNPYLTGDLMLEIGEGDLLPETCQFIRGDSRVSIVKRMQAAHKKVLDELWETRAEGLPISTPQEAVILASIVEKETGIPEERPKVASVFVNRLKKGMRLQSDPTIIYGITLGKEKLGRSLTRVDVLKETDYNTYQIDGLPPTPIANPGVEALKATLNPAETDYLFFVADGTGGHAFSKDYQGHQNNVSKWRVIEKKKQ